MSYDRTLNDTPIDAELGTLNGSPAQPMNVSLLISEQEGKGEGEGEGEGSKRTACFCLARQEGGLAYASVANDHNLEPKVGSCTLLL